MPSKIPRRSSAGFVCVVPLAYSWDRIFHISRTACIKTRLANRVRVPGLAYPQGSNRVLLSNIFSELHTINYITSKFHNKIEFHSQ